ncbi:MAG: glycosyltransferase family 2 protein [Agathobacter sp.]|nr:glycosyltransferase family 2 protein [Agathobacter sp.]
MDKISVVVPVYNSQDFLEKCVDSVLNQTYQILEVILVDDGSTDDSAAMCDKYQKRDSRVKVFHVKNGGVSKARNVGLQNATGQWVTFVDNDDYIELDMYDKMIKAAEETRADIVTCGLLTNDTPMYLKHKEQKLYTVEEAIAECIADEKGSTMYGSVCNKLIKRSLLEGKLKFVSELQMAEDMLFTLSCMKRAKIIVHCPFCGYHYVVREDSMIHKFRAAKCGSVKAHKLMVEELKGEFPQFIERLQIRSYRQAYNIFCDAITSKADLKEKPVVELKKYLKDNWYLVKKSGFSIKERLILLCSVKLPKGADILQLIC